jgi:hypothetical protein
MGGVTKYVVSSLLLLYLTFSSPVTAMMVASDLADAFDRSGGVVIARVISSKMHQWGEYPGEKVCGYELEIDVLETYSGSYIGIQNIGSSQSLEPGREYLLFLDKRERFVSSDHVVTYAGKGEKYRSDCLSNIPLLKANWRYTSPITDTHRRGYVLLPTLLNAPVELEDSSVHVEKDWRVENEGLRYQEVVRNQEKFEDQLGRFINLTDAICYKQGSMCHTIRMLPVNRVHQWLWQRGASHRPEPTEECPIKGLYRSHSERTLAEYLKHNESPFPEDMPSFEVSKFVTNKFGSNVHEWDCGKIGQWFVYTDMKPLFRGWVLTEISNDEHNLLKVRFPTIVTPDYEIVLEGDCYRAKLERRNYEEVYCPIDAIPTGEQ